MMLKIYATVLGILFIGGLIAYSLGVAWTGVSTQIAVVDPTLPANDAFVFLDSVWTWMVLAVVIAAFVYEVVNTQREAQYIG